jgi:UDP-glucose 4-epimerase
MRIVITGALGHIGSRLLHALPNEFPDIEVVIVDNMLTQRYCSLLDLPDKGWFRYVRADVRTADMEEIFAGADAVLHLAAITNAPESFENEQETETVNFLGTTRVAEACAAVGVPMLFPSTTSVYGMQETLVDEDCPESWLRPQSPYAASKLKAERRLSELQKEKGLKHITCRFATIFGTSVGMRFHTAINKFCFQAATGEPLSVWRTAIDQKRPYLHLDDAVDAIVFILRKRLFDGRTYNVLTENATIRQIVDIIQSQLKDTQVEYVDTAIMNQLSYEVSAKRFADAGFTPKRDLRSGIIETLHILGALSRSTPRLVPKKS